MSKQAKASNCGTELPTKVVSTSTLTRLALVGMATFGCLYLSPVAEAQQAYYLPQAASAPVSVNYGALTPYGAPSPAVPGGFQPYGYAAPSARLSAAPKSVFTPYGQPAYGAAPAYGAQPVYGYASVPTVTPFVAPYANPAFAPGAARLPMSTPASNGYPQSYLNVPGAQKMTDAKPTKKKRKKKAAAAPAAVAASTPTATEEGAAAKVAAAEAVLEAPQLPTPAPAATSEAVSAAEPVAAAEPVPAPTPPAEPDAVPASVPSPAANAPASVVAAAAPAAEATSEAAAPSASEATSEATSEGAQPAEQVASAEAPADTNAGTGAPAGGARIVFDAGSDDLPQGATADLDALADKMAADANMKIQVLAYSSGTPDAESQARRKALARGLEVRKYLIGKGVRSNRIDVRALGTKSEGGPADRVDIVPSAG